MNGDSSPTASAAACLSFTGVRVCRVCESPWMRVPLSCCCCCGGGSVCVCGEVVVPLLPTRHSPVSVTIFSPFSFSSMLPRRDGGCAHSHWVLQEYKRGTTL